MNPKARKLLLQQILQAGDSCAHEDPNHLFFTCCRLSSKGVPGYVVDAYWDGLFSDPGCPHNIILNGTADNCLVALGHRCITLPEMYATRLMMLAWFYEMVRSGEFDSFLP